MRRTRFFAAAASLLIASNVHANPPPADSTDALRMRDYADKVRDMKQPGGDVSCCSEADCRPVDNWRVNKDGHYEVFIRKLTADGSWLDEWTGCLPRSARCEGDPRIAGAGAGRLLDAAPREQRLLLLHAGQRDISAEPAPVRRSVAEGVSPNN